MRQVISALHLLAYNLIVSFVLSHSDGDLDWCDRALKKELGLYPNGVWFLFFKGRLEFMRGNLTDCVKWYKKSWKSQDLWPQFHHLCFWEMMWAHMILREWEEALIYAESLVKNSNWSRTIYMYQQAVILIMTKPEESSANKKTLDNLMQQAPTFKQRIAGKSLPMEKFVIKKAERYFAQKKHLVLPALELLYVWNMFRIIGKRQDIVMSMYTDIEEEEKLLQKETFVFLGIIFYFIY